MKLHSLWTSIFAIPLFALACSSYAQEDIETGGKIEKKWEAGIGVGAVYGPDYRGSDEYRHFISPIPYFVYRGKIIRSDREGVRGNFLRTDRYEFTLSASASITPETDKSTLREGMPELGSTIEFGPSFNINLTGDSFAQGWHLQLPWRAVFAIGADESGYIGSVFTPQLVYRDKLNDWTFSYRAGIAFADEDYHDYYYKVDQKYVTAARHYFDASSGYSGWNNQVAFSRKFTHGNINTQLAFFIRYDNISGTDFGKSPLVVSDHSYRGGIALIWVIK